MRAFLAIIALLFSFNVHAQSDDWLHNTLTQEQASYLWAQAWGATHDWHDGNRDILKRPPAITVMSPASLCILAKQPMVMEGLICGVRGYHSDGQIFLNGMLTFDKPLGASIAYHEMLHHIRWLLGYDAQTCEEWVEEERMVRAKQADFLMENGAGHLAQGVIQQIRAYEQACI